MESAIQKALGLPSQVPAKYDAQFVKNLKSLVESSGNSERGKQAYQKAATCVACHKIDDAGGDIGPDLTEVGSGGSLELLIESVLWPNVSVVRTLCPTQGMPDVTSLLKLLTKRKHARAYFYGHTHEWQYARRDHLHLVNQPAVSYYFGKGHAHGWIDMKLTEMSADLQLHCINRDHQQHGERRQVRLKDKDISSSSSRRPALAASSLAPPPKLRHRYALPFLHAQTEASTVTVMSYNIFRGGTMRKPPLPQTVRVIREA